MKIVSLLPSATEILCALGLREQLAGVSHECDFPADVTRLPKVTCTAIDKRQASDAIDRDVRKHLSNHAALYTLDVPLLEKIQPDLIVTQALCDVCAVSASEVDRVAGTLASRPTVVNLEPTRLDDLFQMITELADLTGRLQEGSRLCKRLRQRISAVGDCVAQRTACQPRIAFLEWLLPPFNGGHWTPELITMAGAIDVFNGLGRPSRTLCWADVAAARPDMLFVACCGFSVEQAMHDLQTLYHAGEPLVRQLYEAGQILVANGNHYFNRPGPRLVDSLEILAAALHPAMAQPEPAARATPMVLQ